MLKCFVSIAAVVSKWLKLRAQTSQDLKWSLQRLGALALKLSSRVLDGCGCGYQRQQIGSHGIDLQIQRPLLASFQSG